MSRTDMIDMQLPKDVFVVSCITDLFGGPIHQAVEPLIGISHPRFSG